MLTFCTNGILDVTMDELILDFIPMDNDVLSMEIPDFFRDYFLVMLILIAVPGGGHWDACPGRKILWGDILKNKNLTFLIVFSTFKAIFQTQKTLNQCLHFSSLYDDFAPVKARKHFNYVLTFEK